MTRPHTQPPTSPSTPDTTMHALRHIAAAHRTVLFLVVAAALVSGCAPRPQPSPAPTTSPRTPTPPYAGAPAVPKPLPIAVLDGGPCTALTQQQRIAALGKDATTAKPSHLDGIGPKCVWDAKESGAKITIYYVTEPHAGLSGLYQNSKPQSAVWKPTEIDGHPAVAYLTHQGPDPKDACAVAIGITDTVTIEVTINLGNRALTHHADPCELGITQATGVLATLRERH
ncbi:DUF3558 domain-containing protein [Amycolatopsis sp. NPDC059021]|uniref:DUF3558 domain-containing protein n=1 Tax=Amycolatopsis sp. NPDC059021 TaxID=3346704 RepID=UPI00366C0199